MFGGKRRVKGLRREEVAMLAGMSTDYYTRLERGNLTGVSHTVLESLAHGDTASDATYSTAEVGAAAAFGVAEGRDGLVQSPDGLSSTTEACCLSVPAPGVGHSGDHSGRGAVLRWVVPRRHSVTELVPIAEWFTPNV